MPKIIVVDFDEAGDRLAEVKEFTQEQLDQWSSDFIKQCLPDLEYNISVLKDPFWGMGNIIIHDEGRILSEFNDKFKNLTGTNGNPRFIYGPFIVVGRMRPNGFDGFSEEIDEEFEDGVTDVERLADYINGLPLTRIA